MTSDLEALPGREAHVHGSPARSVRVRFLAWLAQRRQRAGPATQVPTAFRTFDFTHRSRGWGHDCGWRPLPGDRLDMWGWCRGIRTNDRLLLTNPATGSTSRYRVESIRYPGSPADMFFAVAVHDAAAPSASGPDRVTP